MKALARYLYVDRVGLLPDYLVFISAMALIFDSFMTPADYCFISRIAFCVSALQMIVLCVDAVEVAIGRWVNVMAVALLLIYPVMILLDRGGILFAHLILAGVMTDLLHFRWGIHERSRVR